MSERARRLQTNGLAREEREAFWRQAMSETFVPLTVGDVEPDRFGGFIRSDWVGRLMVAEVGSTAQDIRRTKREMNRTDAEYFQIATVYRGVGRVAQDGREAILHPWTLRSTRPRGPSSGRLTTTGRLACSPCPAGRLG